MENKFVLSIDIGIVNLGFTYAKIEYPKLSGSRYKNLKSNEVYQFVKSINVIDCNRIDITKIKHKRVQICDCKLHHDRCIPDYLDHFIQECKYFEECDVLLLERQPPVGITNVQDLLFTKFRDKVIMISPNSVHKYFNLNHCYDDRKEQSEKLSNVYLSQFLNFQKHLRKHDIADAMLMILYYYKIELDKLIKNTNFNFVVDDFEKFRYMF